MNFSGLSAGQRLTVLLELLGGPKYTAQMRGAATATAGLGAATKATSYEMAVASRRTFLANQALYTLRRYSFFATTALIGVGAAVIKLGYGYLSAMQTAKVALRPVIKDTGVLQSYLDRLFKISKYSPFVLTDLAVGFRQMFAGLSQVGVGAPKILTTIQSLTDLMSFTGKTGQGAFQRVSLAIQHLANAGRLTGYAVNQLSRDGIPIMAILNKEFGITGDQLHNISKMGIPASKVLAAINKYAQTTNGVRGAAMRISLHTLSGLFQVIRDSLSQLSGAFIGSSYKGFEKFLYGIAKPGGPLDRISNIGNKKGGGAAVLAISRSITGFAGLGRGFLLLLDIVKNLARVFTNVLLPALIISLHTLIVFWPILWPINQMFALMAKHGKILRWVFALLATEFVITHFAVLGLWTVQKLLLISSFGLLRVNGKLFQNILLLGKAMKAYAFATVLANDANGAGWATVYKNNGMVAKFTRTIVNLITKLKELKAAMLGAGLLGTVGEAAAAAGAALAVPVAALAADAYFGHTQSKYITHIGAGSVTSKGVNYAIGGGRAVGVNSSAYDSNPASSTTTIHTHVHIDGKKVAEAVDKVRQDKRARR